jgi:host cell surface-exposed lipoprotein
VKLSKRKKFVFPILGGFVLLMVIAGLTNSSDKKAAAAPAAATVETTAPAEKAPAAEAPAKVEETRAETAGQENARRSAEDYLSTAAFSRKGLIDQLKYEGYTEQQAVYGVNQAGL